MKRISNCVLLERLEHIKEGIGRIEKHLEGLNGKVSENSMFLSKQKVINAILGAIGLSTLGYAISVILR